MITATLLYLLIFLFPLGQFGRLPLTPGVNLYIHDLIVLILLILNLRHLLSGKLIRPILAFAAVGLLSLILSPFPFTQVALGSLYLWRWLAYAGIYAIVTRQSRIYLKPIPKLLFSVGTAMAITGLAQYVLLPDTRFLLSLGWDEHYYRLIGTLLDPNYTGIILVLTIILGLKTLSRRYYWLLIVSFIALLLTYSRASYLALLSALVFKLFRHNKLKLFVSCFLFLGILLLLPRPGGEGVRLERTQSILDRFTSTQKLLPLIYQRPLVGVGFNLLRYYRADFVSHAASGADNSLVFILATTGTVGLITYFWLLRRQLATISYLLIPVIVHSQFNNTLFFPWVMLWLWIMLGITETQRE